MKPNQGDVVAAAVERREPFGAIVDLPSPYYGVVEFGAMYDDGRALELDDYPKPGQRIRAIVLGVHDCCVYLSLRPSDFARFGVETGPSWDLGSTEQE